MSTQICIRWLVVAMVAAIGATAQAEVPDPPEPTRQDMVAADQQLRWTQRTHEIVRLLAAGKPAEALAICEQLLRETPAQDRDGLVALATGDCHWRLKQYDQARQAYQAAAAAHPELESTVWIRLAETELAAGRFEPAERLLRDAQARPIDPELKSWAALRLAMARERQVIRQLAQVEEAYRQAAAAYVGPNPDALRWRRTHADDLNETIGQLRAALAQMDHWQRMMPVFWTDNLATERAARVELARVRINAETRPPAQDDQMEPDPAAAQTVELTFEKDGKLEVKVAGRKVNLDEATRRQVLKHLEQAVRLSAPADATAGEQGPVQGDKR